MSLPDHLADLERKVSARFDEALAELRQEMRRAVEAGAQRASSAVLAELDKIGPRTTGGLLAGEDLLEMTGAERSAARRDFACSLRSALIAFDGARTQGAVLEALLASARTFGDHAALWLMRPEELLGWASLGFAGEPVAGVAFPHAGSPALQRLAEGRGCVRLAGTDAAHLASVLEIEAPKQALLVPLILRDRVAAVLYLDSAGSGELEIEALQILALAAAQRLELQALATRSYTPTLFLTEEAPASERGLALWDPDALAVESTVPATTTAVDEGTVAHPAWAERVEEVEKVAPAAVAEEHDTIVETMPTVASGFDLVPPARPPEPDGAEIAWQMEEAPESSFMESVPHKDLMAELAPLAPSAPLAPLDEIPEAPQVSGTPTHEIPFSQPPPAADLAPSEWHEVDDSTAPHSTSSVTASTIAFVPPVVAPEPDIANDATVRILHPVLPPPTPPPPPHVATEPETAEEQTHPSLRGPGVPADEPTLARGARTTEVIAPADLQGPGWAFSSTRSPRGSGESALHEEARRLARLLVSEIKLYNEDQVEEGRHNRDIYLRLKEDIDRSRQIYEERVHESVRSSTDYFQQELLRSLAGGDPRALGV